MEMSKNDRHMEISRFSIVRNLPSDLSEMDSNPFSVLHIRDLISKEALSDVTVWLQSLRYNPLVYQGELKRYEAILDPFSHQLVIELQLLMHDIRRKMNLSPIDQSECYAFKYLQKQSVPPHFDAPKHKITAIFYAGCFEGGELGYGDRYGNTTVLQPNAGDLILLVNETGFGSSENPEHWVTEIESGERLTILCSLVSYD